MKFKKLLKEIILDARQLKFVARCIAALIKNLTTLAIAPTGCGKTYMFSMFIKLWLIGKSDDTKVCVLSHRDKLLDQNHSKFVSLNKKRTTSIYNSKVKSWKGQVIFAMAPTLVRPKNLATIPKIDLLIIDEAHRSASPSYRTVIARIQEINPKVRILGVTATPLRSDRQGLRFLFNNIADHITIKEGIKMGRLVPPRTLTLDVGATKQLNKVGKRAGEYKEDEVADILNTRVINKAVIKHWKFHSRKKQTVVFCSNKKHARDVTACFIAAGIKAEAILDDTSKEERNAIEERFDRRETQVLVNVYILTEGWDSQIVECIVLLRMSSFISTIMQMIGRGLRAVDPRLYPGVVKEECLVMDFGISTSEAKLGKLEDRIALGKDEEEIEAFNNHKSCPECNAKIPKNAPRCNLCGYLFLRKVRPRRVKRPLEDVKLRQIELFNGLPHYKRPTLKGKRVRVPYGIVTRKTGSWLYNVLVCKYFIKGTGLIRDGPTHLHSERVGQQQKIAA